MPPHSLAAVQVGFATEWKKGKPGNKIIFTKDGGKVADAEGYITQHWKWDKTRQNPGQIPTEPITLQLNKEIKFIFNAGDQDPRVIKLLEHHYQSDTMLVCYLLLTARFV